MTVSRRSILVSAAAAGVSSVASLGGVRALAEPRRQSGNRAFFSLNYAPHEGSFASRGTGLEQVAYAADQGFRAWEDNEAATRPVAEQEALAKALRQRDMTMGVLVAGMPQWSRMKPVLGGDDDSEREGFLAGISGAVDAAKRLDARWVTVVTGFMDSRIPVDIQTGRVIDVMRRAGDLAERNGLILVMEPLNTRRNHPGIYMQSIAQGFAVAKGADSPSVKVLADLYHEQIQSGNLLPTLEACWDEVGYIQFGDNPGRKEPGTGEINYADIVRWLRARDYAGVIGMEHGNSTPGREGEEALVAAYRRIDEV